MSTLSIPTVELVSTLRAAGENGPLISQDYNDSWTESLADLASLSGFINDILLPMLNGLSINIQPQDTDTPYGLEGRYIFSDTSDTTDQVFYDSLTNQSLDIASSLRILEGMIGILQGTITTQTIEITALQTQLSANSENDFSQAIQNLTISVSNLTTYVDSITETVNNNSVLIQTNSITNTVQNLLNIIAGENVNLSVSGGNLTINSTGGGGGGSAPGGFNTDIQVNVGGLLYGDGNLTFDTATRTIGGTAGLIFDVTGTPSFVATGNAVGTTGAAVYTYEIVAVTNFLFTSISNIVTISNGNSTLNGSNYNQLSWASSIGATTYYISRNTSGGTPNSVGLIGVTSNTSFTDTGLAAETFDPPGPGLNMAGWVGIQNGLAVGGTLLVADYSFSFNTAILPGINTFMEDIYREGYYLSNLAHGATTNQPNGMGIFLDGSVNDISNVIGLEVFVINAKGTAGNEEGSSIVSNLWYQIPSSSSTAAQIGITSNGYVFGSGSLLSPGNGKGLVGFLSTQTNDLTSSNCADVTGYISEIVNSGSGSTITNTYGFRAGAYGSASLNAGGTFNAGFICDAVTDDGHSYAFYNANGVSLFDLVQASNVTINLTSASGPALGINATITGTVGYGSITIATNTGTGIAVGSSGVGTDSGSANGTELVGSYGVGNHTSTGTLGSIYGVVGQVLPAEGAGLITNAFCVYAQVLPWLSANSCTTLCGVYVDNMSTGSFPATNNYGIYVETQSEGYAIYTAGGTTELNGNLIVNGVCDCGEL